MADYNIISNVSTEIVSRLKLGMPQVDSIGLISSISNALYMINVFMYDVIELDRTLYNVGAYTTAICLKYLIFIEGKGAEYQKPYDEQLLLGKTIQILNDNKSISYETGDPPALITLDNISVDEKLRIKTDMKSHPPVLFYKVFPLLIDTEDPTKPAPMVLEPNFNLRGIK